jgi:hypothetical protein
VLGGRDCEGGHGVAEHNRNNRHDSHAGQRHDAREHSNGSMATNPTAMDAASQRDPRLAWLRRAAVILATRNITVSTPTTTAASSPPP